VNALPRHRTVADVMTTKVHIADPSAPFKVLVRLIEENRVSAIPIVDKNGVPVGIVSESDLLHKERRHELEAEANLFQLRKHRHERAKAGGLVASELMTSPLITVPTDTTLAEAARLMQARNVRRLVAVDARGRIAGIVSRSDLLQVFLRTDEDLRADVVDRIIPAVLIELSEDVSIQVHSNVITLIGVVERRSDAEILGRLAGDLDGVVGIENQLTYRWDDTAHAPVASYGN
jgi:CBS domain-containing protein